MNAKTQKWGEPASAIASFEAAGHQARAEGPYQVRIMFQTRRRRVSWWYSCRSGRWKLNSRWSAEFGPRGVEACLHAISLEQAKGGGAA